MLVTRSLARLRAATNQFPEWQRPSFAAPASPEAIDELEGVAGGPLPGGLREFLLQHDEVRAMDVHNGYWLGGTTALIRSVQRGDFPRELIPGSTSTRAVPAATDGGGNAFLVSLDNGRVWRWDRETGSTAEVAGSFPEFLARVADDWEHAAADDADWAFLV